MKPQPQPQPSVGEIYPDGRPLVDQLLRRAVETRASDVHLEPTSGGFEIRLRIDGLLQTIDHTTTEVGRAMVNRLMVMAQLLTYRLDVPQEGRLRVGMPQFERSLELRLAVMPTTHGLRAALRLPAELLQPRGLSELGLPRQVMEELDAFASSEAGMLIVTGPAGSGKTTTIYALLQHIASHSPGLSMVSLEDPVERDLPGVTQIEVSPFGQLTYERALRSILRQDPQVLMLGEIRDQASADLALQAALSGHRLVATFHAGTPAGALSRLMEMGGEPHQIASAVTTIVSQRLLRRRSAEGYRGRVPVAEAVRIDAATRKAVLARADATELQRQMSLTPRFASIRAAAAALVASGITDEAEVTRVLGADEPAAKNAHP